MRPVFNPHPQLKRFDVVPPTGSGKWWRFRRRWLMANPACTHCGLAGEEVHHIVPRKDAPQRMFDPTNLMTLCRACHAIHHGREIPRFFTHFSRAKRGG